jgi:hypothetical protein
MLFVFLHHLFQSRPKRLNEKIHILW